MACAHDVFLAGEEKTVGVFLFLVFILSVSHGKSNMLSTSIRMKPFCFFFFFSDFEPHFSPGSWIF